MISLPAASASDIGVNNIVADDPSQLRAGPDGKQHRGAGSGPAWKPALFPGPGQPDFPPMGTLRTVASLGQTLLDVNDDLVSSQVMAQMLANERGAGRRIGRCTKRPTI